MKSKDVFDEDVNNPTNDVDIKNECLFCGDPCEYTFCDESCERAWRDD